MPRWLLPWPVGASANDSYRRISGRVVLSDEAQRWRDQVGLIVRQSGARLPDGELTAVIVAVPPADGRPHDLDNLVKPLLDAVFLALGADDARIRHLDATRAEPDGVGGIELRIE